LILLGKDTPGELRPYEQQKATDEYVRRVLCAEVDANAEQVRSDMPWAFARYAPENPPLYTVRSEARAARHGLWQNTGPVPPWELRRAR
jgi:endonuclease YncB( thermonuclease family)